VHPNAEAVKAAATAAGLDIEPVEFPDGTRTAEDAARAIGVTVGQIVKSLVFRVGDDIVIALVSGSNRLDTERLAAAAGTAGAVVGRVDADAVRAATGYPIGGVPPFGHPAPLRTFVDEDLARYDVVWAAAGTPNHVFSIPPADLIAATTGVVAPLRA
jgi:prolyl-tRNA editing enzyme YbaK/EbsC (Cys-tRNA(Pro) deacylase)